MSFLHDAKVPKKGFRLLGLSMLFTVIGAGSASALAQDLAAGKAKAQSCAMCHGAMGLSQMPGTPSLAGQPAQYLADQLKNFRSGKRPNEIMGVIAKPLTDKEIADLAAWYESNKIVLKSE